MRLFVDGEEVTICRREPCPDCAGLTRVFAKPKGEKGGPHSQYDIPRSGKFRTSGHLFEWKDK